MRAVLGPGRVVFGKASTGELFGRDFLVAISQRGYDPDVVRVLRIGVAGAVEAIDGMVDDADIEYNLGVCLSELGRIQGSVAPLEKCLALDPNYVSGLVGLGVA